MTKKTAVLIPSRNESYLSNTIHSCFENAQGNLEVVVTLEGYWPSDWKELTEKYPNLHTVHHGEPRGLRAAVNSAAASAISRGADYLFKLDAHCMLDEGFDVKLLADMEDNWIVVPRRKRLDAENWTIRDVGKPDVDYHYLSFPDDPNDFGGPGLNGKVWDARIKERLGKPEYDLDDEMSSQGSAYFLSSKYFQQLELMDQASYGPFWNEFQECGLKCWLSGGRVKVNKKTWYAHLHKSTTYVGTDGKKGRGYTLPESWLQQGAGYTKRWIWNEAWPKQTLPFEWLIDHFWPVPTWPENWREVLYAERKPRTVPVSDFQVYQGVGGVLAFMEATRPKPAGLTIHSARYGIADPEPPFQWGRNSIDVADRLRLLIKNDSLDIIVNNSTLAPGQNPFRGKKKTLLVEYSYDGGERIKVERDEKDWLIIGQVQRVGGLETAELIRDRENKVIGVTRELPQGGTVVEEVTTETAIDCVDLTGQLPKTTIVLDRQPPRTPTALNDYLIRRFQISPQRLRAPMPIELREFHRNDLAQLFAELGFTKGCEVGVAEGNFSQVLLEANPDCQLLLVDPWHAYAGQPQNKSNEKHEYAYNEVLRKTKGYKVDIRQGYSMDVVEGILLGELDYCYIDASHLFDDCVQDLIEWSKRVRSGGIVSGDDYYQLDQKRWIGGGVVEAVQAYVNAHQIKLWFTCSGHKSYDYFWVRP